jgi:hypothetical protein
MNKNIHKQSRPAQPEETSADDLKLIVGIGPAVEQRLRAGGIDSFARLAALTEAEIAGMLAGARVTVARIRKEQWISQARELGGRSPVVPSETVARQHYETYTVRLLLNDDNDVRYTEVQHVQSNEKQTWAGWNEKGLARFISGHGAVRRTPAPTPVKRGAVPSTVAQPAPEPDGAPVIASPEAQALRVLMAPGGRLSNTRGSPATRPPETAEVAIGGQARPHDDLQTVLALLQASDGRMRAPGRK